MKKLLHIIISCFLTFSLSAQIKFNVVEPGCGTNVNTMVQTSDHGYMIAGDNSINWQPGAGYLAKLDPFGNLSWQKTIGYSSAVFEMNEIILTQDSNCVVAGIDSASIFILKLFLNGDTVWTHSVVFNCMPTVTGLKQTFDGGFIVCGYLTCSPFPLTKMLLVKFDSAGNFQWSNSYTMAMGQNITNEVLQLPDSNYLLAGFYQDTTSSHNKDGCLLVVSQNGIPLSNKIYADTTIRQSEITSATISDSTLNLLQVNQSTNSCKLINSDFSGIVNWVKEYSIPTSCYNCPVQLLRASDGGHLIMASIDPWIGYLIRLDSVGDFLWDFNFVPPQKIINTDDGGFAILMDHYENLANQIGVIKMDSAGNTTGCVNAGNGTFYVSSDVDTGTATVSVNPEGSSIDLVFPISSANLLFMTGCIYVDVSETEDKNFLNVFPTPSSGDFNIALDNTSGNFKIQISDIYGKIIFSENYHFNNAEPVRIKNDFASGIYTLTIINEKNSMSKKIIIAQK